MKKNIILITCIFSILFIHTSRAQEYGTSVGVRFGSLASGLNVKTFLSADGALEGIIGLGHHSIIITALYEKHHAINSAEGLTWYVGAGAHVGFFDHHGTYWRYKDRGEKYYKHHDGNDTTIPGIDIIIGLEWRIPNAPLVLGLDVKPQVDFYHGASTYFDAAISVRYIL